MAQAWGVQTGGPPVLIVFDVFVNLVAVVLFAMLAVLVHRAIRRLSGPPSSTQFQANAQ